MPAYKFLNQKYGLKSLYERRLRRTRISELNDPFELRPYDLTNASHRTVFLRTRDELAERYGLLCFSAGWNDPVIWSHYSDNHRGLCLGFDVPPSRQGEPQAKKVEYIDAPLPLPKNLLSMDEEQRRPIVDRMLYTKYRFWEYEKEIRVWTDLEEEFFDFCDGLQLVEVIIGAASPLPTGEITRALGSSVEQVKVTRASPAHNAFEIV
jgi:hypothetical protein